MWEPLVEGVALWALPVGLTQCHLMGQSRVQPSSVREGVGWSSLQSGV